MIAASRRHFLRSAAAVSLGFAGFRSLSIHCANALPSASDIPFGFGPLKSDPAAIFDLPEGFTYTLFSRVGEIMDDSLLVPGSHDGMAAFPGPRGKTILVRNHELNPDQQETSAFGAELRWLAKVPSSRFYDFGKGELPGIGGTTTLVFDTKTQKLESHYLSLAGTLRNCAGGPTPWNSWVTCEETTLKKTGVIEKDHGYNFEVPAVAKPNLVDPIPLKGMGRFNHEAVAVDPKSGAVYETEDATDGCIYRYLPDEPEKLAAGGRLQALAVRGRKSLDTRNFLPKEGESEPNPPVPVGEVLETSWVDLEDVESPNDDLRHQAYEKGAARFARGEGMWYGNDAVYFACTSGGAKKLGQVWRYIPSPSEGSSDEEQTPGRLELFIEPNDGTLVTNCDNLTVAPWGDLILCEDASSDDHACRLVGVTPHGEIYQFGRTRTQAELAGATFSPDGSTLFVNLQTDGATLAITGPWERRTSQGS